MKTIIKNCEMVNREVYDLMEIEINNLQKKANGILNKISGVKSRVNRNVYYDETSKDVILEYNNILESDDIVVDISFQSHSFYFNLYKNNIPLNSFIFSYDVYSYDINNFYGALCELYGGSSKYFKINKDK